MKLKIINSVLSLVVLCSAPTLVNAESTIAGQLVANPVATVSAGKAQQKIGSQATSYLEGDVVSTEANSSAKISLISGLANIVIAPNTVMSVVDKAQLQLMYKLLVVMCMNMKRMESLLPMRMMVVLLTIVMVQAILLSIMV